MSRYPDTLLPHVGALGGGLFQGTFVEMLLQAGGIRKLCGWAFTGDSEPTSADNGRFDPHHVQLSFEVRSRFKRYGSLVTIPRQVACRGGDPLEQHAPVLSAEGLVGVSLKGDDGVTGSGIELRTGNGGEEYRPVGDHKVNRKDHRQGIDAHGDPTE